MDPLATAMVVATPSDQGLVAANWTIFADTYNSIDTPLVNAVNAVLGALTTYVSGPLKYLVIAWIAGTALMVALGRSEDPLSGTIVRMMQAAIAMFLVANTANFNQWVGGPLTGLPTDIGNALVNAVGGTHIQGGNLFDEIWNRAYTSGLVVYRALPDTWKGMFLSLGVFAFWAVSLAVVALSFLIFIVSHVLVALIISIGPLFIAAGIFPVSRFLLAGWLSGVASAILAQVLVITLLSMIINVETTELAKVVAEQPGGANVIGMLQTLLGVAALLGICAMLIKQIPNIATGIAGGVYHATNQYSAALWSGGSAAARNTGAALQAAGRSASQIGTTRSSVTGPAGRSLSG